MIKVSIITVVYYNDFIETAIKSVVEQDYPSIEYIIINGGSTEQTLQKIHTYDSYIHKIISEPDLGIYDAINKGLKLATGDIVGLLNADDLLVDNHVITNIVKNFNKDEELEAVFADVMFVAQHDLNKVLRYYSTKYFKPWMFKLGFQPAHPTFYARRNLFLKHGYYNIKYKIAGDFELMLRFIFIHKIKVKYINEVLVKMRIGGISTSGIKSIKKLNSEILDACKNNGVYSNHFMVYSKYFIKWWGFVFKKV